MKFLTALILSAALAACASRSTDEERVREVFANMESAAEARDASDVLEFIAADYTDNGGYDKAQLQSFLRGYFLVNPNVELLVSIERLEFPVAGLARAEVGVTSVLAGDRERFNVELRLEEGEWRIVRADRIRA
jgi:hypothetical protein